MLEKIKKIKENKILKTIWNIIYTLMFLIVVLMLIIVVAQRMTNNDITIGGIRMFSVATGSMVPVYEVGDVLISKEVQPETIKVGDDIVYQGEKGSYVGKVITHRVISVEKLEDGNYKIITQGVANNQEDPAITQTQVYGKVIYKVHILSLLTRLTKNVYGMYIIIFIIVGIFAYKNIKNIINRENEENEESDGEDSKNTEKNSD